MEASSEVWKSVVGFETLYEVSNLGNVKSINRDVLVKNTKEHFNRAIKGRLLGTKSKARYNNICLYRDDLKHSTSIHRVVAEAFIPNPENKPVVNHKNGQRHDNRVENLEWLTQDENIQHSISTGLTDIEASRRHIKMAQIAIMRNVIDTETGDVYDSITEAALAIGKDGSYLSKMLRGVKKNTTTLEFYST